MVGFDASWHSGIIGLVASKLKDTAHRPAFAFAQAEDGSYKASGRSIPGYHLRDALARIDARNPGMLVKFGGHAMAAGLTLSARALERFTSAFDADASEHLTEEMLTSVLWSDGSLPAGRFTLETVWMIDAAGPWGQGFPAPTFDDVFTVVGWQEMGQGHLKMMLMDERSGEVLTGVRFNCPDQIPPPQYIHAVYHPEPNHFRGKTNLQLIIDHFHETEPSDAIELEEHHELGMPGSDDRPPEIGEYA